MLRAEGHGSRDATTRFGPQEPELGPRPRVLEVEPESCGWDQKGHSLGEDEMSQATLHCDMLCVWVPL